ncbi:hypothetical protein [Methanobrevibacter sp. DSM 116169]|uniref:hypothetical protein n=1 Tax=Methanobrevibacter sp. DSM 116169 TaxID=3242727 RepID=UPI0038FD14F0
MNSKDFLIIILIAIVIIMSIGFSLLIFNQDNGTEISNITINNSTDNSDVIEENEVAKTYTEPVKEEVESEETYLEKLRRENAEADRRQICPSCGVYTGSEGKYCVQCWDDVSGGAEYQGGFL